MEEKGVISKGRLFQIISYHKNKGNKKTQKKFNLKEETLGRYLRRARQFYPDIYEKTGRKAKILIFDIENSPNVVHTWGLWNVNVAINQIQQPWYILSWAAKWLGEGDVFFDALSQYPSTFANDPTDDRAICESMWELLDEADIVITHNGLHHDIPKLKSQFIKHGIPPYSPIKHIDTCKSSRGMGFTSKKLQFIAQHLGIGQKLAHTGHQLWTDCMNPVLDEEAWDLMVEYNCVDVELLEGVYLALRPWIQSHPNITLYSDAKEIACVKCGGAVEKDVDAYTASNIYEGYHCTECGSWSRSRYQKITTERKKKILTNYL